jgi:hypothetical protein
MDTAMKNPRNVIENFDLYAPKLVSKEEFFSPGHRACQGCGESLAIRLMCKALGKDTVITNGSMSRFRIPRRWDRGSRQA